MILEGNIFTTRRTISETVVCFQNAATHNFFARNLKMVEGIGWIFN
jgi:hypothetical protein